MTTVFVEELPHTNSSISRRVNNYPLRFLNVTNCVYIDLCHSTIANVFIIKLYFHPFYYFSRIYLQIKMNLLQMLSSQFVNLGILYER
jgi:hypothetical protein